MNLTSKNKIILTIVAFLLFIVLMVVFVVDPLYQKIRNNSQDVLFQKQKLAVLESKINSLEKFKIIYKNLEEILIKIEDLFTDPEVPVGFIAFLENTADESQLTIKISPAALSKSEQDPWPSLGFRVSSKDDFPNFLKFLEKVENSHYLIEFQNLSVDSLSGSSLLIKVFTE